MALTSPGVEVQVIDESFYTAAEPGSVPLVVVATAKNKMNGAGTATAAGTLASNAKNVYRITSQRELVETFGVPFFEKTATNNPIHGGERNEYGLLAAYSLLGVTNSVFIMRADVDLNELAASTAEPGSEPLDGTWWINTASSAWGIQEWNGNLATSAGGQKFATKTPIVLTDDDTSKLDSGTPKASVGSIGDYAVVFKTVKGDGTFLAQDEFVKVFFKSAGNTPVGIVPGTWVLVGSQDWIASWPTASGTASVGIGNAVGADLPTPATFFINGTEVTVNDSHVASDIATTINGLNINGVYAADVRGRLTLYSTGDTATDDSTNSGSITLSVGTDTGTVNLLAASGASDANVLTTSQLKLRAGTYLAPKLTHAPHTQRPQYKRSEQSAIQGYPTGSLWLKTTEPNGGANIRVSRWSRAAGTWLSVSAPMHANGAEAIYALDRTGGIAIPTNRLYVQYNARENIGGPESDNDTAGETAEFRFWRRKSTGAATATSSVINTGTFTGTVEFEVIQTVPGASNYSAVTTVSFNATGLNDLDLATAFAASLNGASFTDVGNEPVINSIQASVTSDNRLVISHKTGGEIRLKAVDGNPFSIFTPFNLDTGAGTANFYALSNGGVSGTEYEYLISNWAPLAASVYYASITSPLAEPVDGQLWYNPTFDEVDLMVHDGDNWVGYLNEFSNTDAEGPRVAATAPEAQRNGDPLVNGDIWISTADLENFPAVYRWDGDNLQWVLLDKTDQQTEDGILFGDARVNTDGLTNAPASIVDLLTSDFLDPDAPDPVLYPKGMILWNTRRSYGNVKRYVNNYIDITELNPRMDDASMADYFPDRWVTASPNNEDGSGNFGRKAQRSVVVAAIKSAIDTSEEARDEERRNFNIVACPGYPEALSNLINLNIDRKVTAFVIGDTPLRLKSDATTLTNWGTNAALAFDNGDQGIVSYDEYSAVYYPNGFTTDLSGANAVVPASHMMLRTMILSDQAAYPWFAPAGTRRGGITNATAVGYIDAASGEFKTVALNNGQRDTLYELKINPIPFFVGVGHIAFGQKTRARNASALDRINVARLIVYLRSQLTKLARPYLFEPNDKQTRDEIKGAVESLLIELVGLRALYDFAVVCDESNNTPARIDRNELWLDIAIEPTKAVEFIYIPLRIKNTGEI